MWDSLITYKHQITQGFLTEPERFLYWSYRDWLLSNKLRWKHLKLGEMNGMQVTRHYKSWPHAYYKNLIVDCVGKTRAFYKPLFYKRWWEISFKSPDFFSMVKISSLTYWRSDGCSSFEMCPIVSTWSVIMSILSPLFFYFLTIFRLWYPSFIIFSLSALELWLD